LQNLSITKPHYPILNGLRGVASMMVIAFHLLEAHSTGHHDQIINHGYLAVDFFFLLSGFVIGYAYDDRWGTMGIGDFFKRRLIRLQPMIIVGMIVGALTFYFQDSVMWPTIHDVPVWKVILVMLIGFTLLPLPISMDIRGWQEMHPLNGPGWSLFFEYIANIFYALGVRKFSKGALSILVLLSGIALIHFAVTNPNGDIIGGWALNAEQLRVGFTRMMYPFFAGLLLFRVGKLAKVKNAFFWSSLLIVIVLSIPRIGGKDFLWQNGLYDALCIVFVFPLVVFLGASGELKSKVSERICSFLGDISYPIYITHFPFVYLYTAWVHNNKVSVLEGLPVAFMVFCAAVLLAYLSLRFYDEPLRNWLKRRF
jgi:peptidoglycan/LPS O-acetylase OafA/YrhL